MIPFFSHNYFSPTSLSRIAMTRNDLNSSVGIIHTEVPSELHVNTNMYSIYIMKWTYHRYKQNTKKKLDIFISTIVIIILRWSQPNFIHAFYPTTSDYLRINNYTHIYNTSCKMINKHSSFTCSLKAEICFLFFPIRNVFAQLPLTSSS